MSTASLGRARRHRSRRRHAELRTAAAELVYMLRSPALPDDLWGRALVALTSIHSAIPGAAPLRTVVTAMPERRRDRARRRPLTAADMLAGPPICDEHELRAVRIPVLDVADLRRASAARSEAL